MIELIILDAILLAGGLLVLRSLRPERRRSGSAHPCQAAEMRDVPRRRPAVTELTLRLAFVYLVDGAVVLDGIVADEDTTIGPVGWPVTVRLCRPNDSSVVNWMCGLLRQWANESSFVQVTFRDGAPRSRVSITDGATTLHFDPAPVDGGQLRDV